MKSAKFAALLVGAGMLAGIANAQETGTLKKIKDSGQITLGVRDSSIPFSYLDDKQSYQGYSVDICLDRHRNTKATWLDRVERDLKSGHVGHAHSANGQWHDRS